MIAGLILFKHVCLYGEYYIVLESVLCYLNSNNILVVSECIYMHDMSICDGLEFRVEVCDDELFYHVVCHHLVHSG